MAAHKRSSSGDGKRAKHQIAYATLKSGKSNLILTINPLVGCVAIRKRMMKVLYQHYGVKFVGDMKARFAA